MYRIITGKILMLNVISAGPCVALCDDIYAKRTINKSECYQFSKRYHVLWLAILLTIKGIIIILKYNHKTGIEMQRKR